MHSFSPHCGGWLMFCFYDLFFHLLLVDGEESIEDREKIDRREFKILFF
jgi:hypothetical protein